MEEYIRVALSAEGINSFSRTTFAMATESGGFGDIPVLHGGWHSLKKQVKSKTTQHNTLIDL